MLRWWILFICALAIRARCADFGGCALSTLNSPWFWRQNFLGGQSTSKDTGEHFFLVSWVFSCEHIQFLHVVLLVFTMVTAAGYFCLHCIMFSKTAMLGHSQLSGPLDRHKASQDLPCPCWQASTGVPLHYKAGKMPFHAAKKCVFCCWCQVFKWFNPEISWCLFTIVYPLPILEDPNRRSSSLDLSPAINELDTFYPNHCLIQSVDLTSSPLPDTDCADMMRRWCKLNDGIATPVRLLQCGHPTNFNGFITP